MMTQNIEIAQASKKDFHDIQHLFRKMFEIYHEDQNVEYPYTDHGISYVQQCIAQNMAFVAKDGGKVIGFIIGEIEKALPFKTYKTIGHLHNLFVGEGYRGQGIGEKLVTRFIEGCHNKHVCRILTDSDDKEPLKRFYTSIGFRITGINYEFTTV